ncbi:polyketide synthase dehydratase domain-containing protein, partial [Streptomyces sp. Root264]
QAPLPLPAAHGVRLQVVMQAPDAAGRRAVAVYSRPEEGAPDDDEAWTCHATGVLSADPAPPAAPAAPAGEGLVW